MKRLDESRIASATGMVAERVRQSTAQVIGELQGRVELVIVKRDLVVPGTTTNNAVTISHRLGRVPSFVWFSAPRVKSVTDLASLTAGMIVDLTAILGLDRARFLKIGAFGFAVDVVIDVAVA